MPRRIAAASVALAAACIAAWSPQAAAIDWVTVGNAGNAADTINAGTNTNYGAVNYEYRVGKYEVTIGQYTRFLNAVAQSDPYGLYNSSMATDLNSAGIARTGSSGAYNYSVIDNGGNSGNRPITYVSWWDAARFANWVQNGQGAGGTETGAYTLNGATSGTAPAKNPGAQFYIPTENEWYKAAYYSPLLNSGSGGYYAYATQSNVAPGNIIGGGSNQANHRLNVSGTLVYSVTQSSTLSSSQNYLTNVGAFTTSASYYGTFDQNGNVDEWNDLTAAANSSRGYRGGSWKYGQSSSGRETTAPTNSWNDTGFRLASSGALFVSGSQSFTNDVRESGDVTTGGYAQFNNGYEGVLTVSGGTAAFAGSVSGTVAVSNGGAALFTTGAGFTQGVMSLTAGSQARFTPGASSTIIAAAAISGSGGLLQSGSGTTVLTGANTYTGTTTVAAGTLQVGNSGTTGSLATGTAPVVNDAALVFARTDAYGGALANVISGSGGVTLRSGAFTLSGSNSYAGGTVVRGGTLALAPTGVIAHGTANVVVGRLSGDIGALSLGAGTLTGSNGILGNDSGASGVASVSGSGAWTSNGSLTVGSLGTGTLSIADTGLVRVGGTAGNGTLTLASGSGSRGTLNLGTGGLVGTLQTGTVAGGAGTAAVVFNHTSGSYAFAPNITGTLNLAHSGSGTTILVGANTYTGTTTLAAGVLQAGNPAALGSTGTISFTGGALRFTAASAATDWSPRIAGSSGPVALDLAGQGVTLGSTFAGSLGASNTGGLTVIGPGQLTLAGNAAYSGTTTIQATGTLQVGNPNGGTVTPNSGSLGTGPVVANGALVFNRGDDYGGAVGNVISGSGNLVLTRGSLTLSAGNSYGGGTTIRSGALALSGGSISHPGAALVVGDVSGDNAALLLPSGVVTNESGSVGRGAGSVGLATVSGGTWANSGDLNVGVSGTGTLTMTGGVVTVGGTLSRGTFGTINLNAGGTLQIGTGGTTGALAVSTLTNNGTLIFNRSHSSEYAGVISGSGAVAKQGAGNLVLTGTSSYTGATTVSAGRLSVDGALGNSPVAILATAELGGSGAIGGAVSVAAGGTLSPGNSIESLATGAATFAAGATFEYEVDSTNLSALGTAADLLVVNGNLTLDPGNGTILAFTDLAGSPNAFVDYTTIFALINYSGAWNGGLFTYGGSVLADGGRFFVGTQEWEIDYDRTSAAGLDNFTADYLPAGSFVAITAVPEPSTWALAAGGLACAAWGAWRRCRRDHGRPCTL